MPIAKLIIVLFLLMGGLAQAEPYTLSWDELNSSERRDAPRYSLELEDSQVQPAPVPAVEEETAPATPQAVSVWDLRADLQGLQPPQSRSRRTFTGNGYSNRVPSVQVPTYNIELSAYQHFDSYTGNYRLVHHVETIVYRGGLPLREIHENQGQFTEFEIFINGLHAGDRYEAVVVWDDGSYTAIDRTIDRFPEENVIIDQPLFSGF